MSLRKKIDSLVSSTDKENKSIIDQLIGEKVQLKVYTAGRVKSAKNVKFYS